MAKETFVPSNYDESLMRGSSDPRIDIEANIVANERQVTLMSRGGRFVLALKASDAHLLAVKLFGMSENHAEPLPKLEKLKPGTLVKAYYRNGRGEVVGLGGGYEGATQRVSGSRSKTREGYIRVTAYPGVRSQEIERVLVVPVDPPKFA